MKLPCWAVAQHVHLLGSGRPEQRVQNIRHGGALARVGLNAALDQVRNLHRQKTVIVCWHTFADFKS